VKANQQIVLDWVNDNVKNIETRDYQIEAWAALQQRRAEGRKRALVHLATGLGKTSVAAVDVFHYLKEEKPGAKVLFVSHMTDISQQAQKTFSFVNPDLKTDLFRGKIKDVDVTFATFQALYKNNKLDTIDPNQFSYIIWDEAHHIEAETFSAVRKHFVSDFQLGLTATPERADGRDIFNYFGNPVFTKSLADGINDGWLSAIDYHIVFDEAIKKAMNDKFELKSLKDIRELFAIRSRNEVISEEVLQRRHKIGLDKAKTIVFCQNISAAVEMAALLGGEVYHSDVNADERISIMKRFKTGALQVICTVDMFNEGIDIPDARLVVFLRSTSSRTIFEQQLGRGLRKAPGKDSVTVLDFVANVERINFVRELGHRVAAAGSARAGQGGHGAVLPKDFADPNAFGFTLSNFEFEDQVIELMERYDTIKRLEHLKTEDVVIMYNKTKSIQRTADHFHVTWQAVKKHLVKAGINTALHFEASRGIDIDTLVKQYAEPKSVNELAKEYSVTPWVIRNKLLKANVDLTPRNVPNYASPELIEAFNRLCSVRAAAEAVGIGRHRARRRLLNSGIDTTRAIAHSSIPLRADIYNAYNEHNGDIFKIVEQISPGRWTRVYKALDRYGWLQNQPRPITSAIAAATYYKFGNLAKAGEYLGVSGVFVGRKARGAKYIKRYIQGGKDV